MTKRKKDDTTEVREPTGREKKKQKIASARTIQVQSTQSNENTVAGPSTMKVRFKDSMEGLPGAIDVERFAEARAFEIDAMHKAMKTASASSTQRAWQALPRHLRRRAASHDVRRVPLRLREKARAEMDPVRKKALGRSTPKRGRDKRISRTESFLKRQRDKTWLETHLWHAKRMKMENMWGYRLAMQPTEKSFRPSHRASLHGSILHDASYYSVIELKGLERDVKQLLEICCDPQGQGPGAKRYITGARALETHIYKPRSYPYDLIAPITIIWKPVTPKDQAQCTSTFTSHIQEPSGQGIKLKYNGKGKEKAIETASSQPTCTLRTVWIRSHPSVFDVVFSALQTSASWVLDTLNQAGVSEVAKLEVADLRGKLNFFEIMGPKSSQVVKGAFTVVAEDKREEFKKFWSSLTDLQTPGSAPRGMIIGFKVIDPRLKFPPKNAKLSLERSTSPITTIPSSTLAQSDLWDEMTRDRLSRPRYKKKDLDDRRAKNLVPGTPLSPLRQDDRIPVLLIQRSLESASSAEVRCNPGSSSQSLHGWTLIVPAGWSMPFFSSLTFTGTRVAGQRERQTQSFEAGCAYFPRDYPFTSAYDAYAKAKEEEERARWERKPPAKRVNYEQLGTMCPWRADWEAVLGLTDNRSNEEVGGEDFILAQREDHLSETMRNPESKMVRPWLLRGPDIRSIFSGASKLFNPGAGLRDEINKLRFKRSYDLLDSSIKSNDIWNGALVLVRLYMCGRGAPGDLAIIYAIEDEEMKMWERVFSRNKEIGRGEDLADGESAEEARLSDIKPSQDSIIGYITSGNFSLSRGEGFTIGAIPVARLLDLQQQTQRLHPNCRPSNLRPSSMLVKVRDRGSHKCRAAHLDMLDE